MLLIGGHTPRAAPPSREAVPRHEGEDLGVSLEDGQDLQQCGPSHWVTRHGTLHQLQEHWRILQGGGIIVVSAVSRYVIKRQGDQKRSTKTRVIRIDGGDQSDQKGLVIKVIRIDSGNQKGHW